MQEALIDKLKGMFRSEKGTRILVALGLAGLVCILISSWLPDSDDEESDTGTAMHNTADTDNGEKYAQKLEERLEDMLTEIDGVGSCKVMITVRGSTSHSYAQDSEQYADADSQEIKREYVLLDDTDGDSALVEYTENPEVTGVIIACEGGEHNVVREMIYEAAEAVLDIPSNRICVVKKTDESGE